jgi:hypothetical protein
MTFTFAELIDPAVAGSEQAAEAAVGFAIGRISEHFKAVDGDKPRTDEKFETFFFFTLVIGAHHAGKRVAIGNADACQP